MQSRTQTPEALHPSLRPLAAASRCAHCGSALPSKVFRLRDGETVFCCAGCRSVYELLNARGLSEYYTLRGADDPEARPATEASSDLLSKTAYLDDPGFLKLYALEHPDGSREMEFFVEGIHCAACLWLLEKVPEFVPGVESVRLNLHQSTAKVRLSPGGGSFASAAAEFRRLGYPAHPVRGEEAEVFQKKENRLSLIRIGVAAACMGNIMLLAVSVYAGAEGALARRFNWISGALFLPSFLFSAWPFYRSAWSSLKARQVAIDVPVVLGILFGAAASTANLISGSGHVYFDSLSALIFLLLSSRYVLARAQQGARTRSRLAHFLAPSTARRVSRGTEEEVPTELLVQGDLIEVRAGETVPADGVVAQGRTRLNCAWLTGESRLTEADVGHPIFAGTVNESAPILIRVKATGYQTRLGQILSSIEQGEQRKAPVILLTDQVARYFVFAVLALSLGMLALGPVLGLTLQESLNRALALAIVTCPCALALATPLAFTEALGFGAKHGLLIKGGDALERLARAERIYLDKTGTLTAGRHEVLVWKACGSAEERAQAEIAALALERRSSHPLAHAICRHFSDIDWEIPEVSGFRETIGRGVEGRAFGSHFELGRASNALIRAFSEELAPDERAKLEGAIISHVALLRDGQPAALIYLGDELRAGSREAVARIRELGLDPWILTGDTKEAALAVARAVEIPESRVIWESSPETKAALVSKQSGSVMVGDGANDAFALSRADVGVAVHGGMEVSLKAADCYLARQGAGPIVQLVELGRASLRIVKRNLAFSLFYNAVGAALALAGHVTPLLAAVLMPASALTVFLSSRVGLGHSGQGRRSSP